MMFFNKKKPAIITGKSKPLEVVTLDDMLKNPIWVFALDEEENEDQDETWIKPVLNSTDIDKKLVEGYILLKNKTMNVFVSACLDVKQKKIDDITFWENDEWKPISSVQNIKFPLELISIPSIEGKEDYTFILE